jgi:hypothetical protein
MNLDHYFAIGKPHAAQGQPCQDYAGSGFLSETAGYAIVADGCSGAQARTEIGAQALVAAFERVLVANGNRPPVGDALGKALQVEIGRSRISGNDPDYLATLAGVVVGQDFGFAVILGDGVIAEKFIDGTIRITEIEWADNTPFYPAYRWNASARQAFFDRLGERTDAAAGVRTIEVRKQNEALERISSVQVMLPFATVENGFYLDLASDLANLQAVAVFSDGVSRIGDLDTAAACAELLAFRTLRGEFVKRRCLRAIETFAQRGWSLGDDLSMAAINLGGVP